MPVEREGLFDALRSHRLEADRIGQRELLLCIRPEKPIDRPALDLASDVTYFVRRVLLECVQELDGCQRAAVSLYKYGYLGHYQIRRNEAAS